MKKAKLLLLIGLATLGMLMPAAALAENGQIFPDLSGELGSRYKLLQSSYVYSDTFICDAYQWDYPDGWAGQDHSRYADYVTARNGWPWKAVTEDGFSAYRFTGANGEQALLVPEFSGRVLLLIPAGYQLTGMDVPGSSPTAAPAAPPRVSGGWWGWETRTVDCPSCVGGACPICHGTGTYRMYGEAVPCRRSCSACDGQGTITQQIYVYHPN